MAKTAIDAPRSNIFFVNPEKLTLVYEKDHPLYDPRVEDEPDERMVDNIAMHGVLEPIIVRKNGEKIEVVVGRGRTKAALEANKRLSAEGKPTISVPAIIKGGSDADLFGIMISENEIRRGDTMLVKGNKARKLLNLGYTVQKIAITFGVSRQAVESWLSADELPQPIKDAVEAGDMTATAAIQMAGRPREEQVEQFETVRREGRKPTAKIMRGAAKEITLMRIKSRSEIMNMLESCIERMDDYAIGYKAALLWVLGEEAGND